MLTKKNYIRRGDNVDQQKLYKEGRQCLTTTKKLYIRKWDNVDKKKLYKEGRQCWPKKNI